MSRNGRRDSHRTEENVNGRSHRGEKKGKSGAMGEDPYQILPVLQRFSDDVVDTKEEAKAKIDLLMTISPATSNR